MSISSDSRPSPQVRNVKDLKLKLTNKINTNAQSRNLNDFILDADLIMNDNLMSTKSITTLTLDKLNIKITNSPDEIIQTVLLKEPIVYSDNDSTVSRYDYKIISTGTGTGKKFNKLVKNTKSYTITYSYDPLVPGILTSVENINGLTLSKYSSNIENVFVNIPIESSFYNINSYLPISIGENGSNSIGFEYKTRHLLSSFITIELANAKFKTNII